MKTSWPILLLLLCLTAGSACRQGTHTSFSQPPESALVLDSTTLGVSTVIQDLNVPWEIYWGPDDRIWFTEQSGTISAVMPETGERKVMLVIPEVYRQRSLGLLGMALHPTEPYVFVDYTHLKKNSTIVSKLVRYTRTKDTLKDPLLLLEFPGNTGHNGSRVTIAPDGKVMLATGDAARYPNAPDTASLNGKILRMNTDGSVPADNPYPGKLLWSRGHRNIQGLAFTSNGHFFASEHGDATDDELNLIRQTGYYAWPHIEGYADRPKEKAYADTFAFIPPVFSWTPTIAPAGIDHYLSGKIPEWRNSLLMVTLKNASLRVIRLNETQDSVLGETVYLSGIFGRLRDLCVSPSGDIYLATSNRDWNPGKGFPKEHDDKIIRLSPIPSAGNLPVLPQSANLNTASLAKGAMLYASYCEACHKPDGRGIKGSFPKLDKSPVVTGDAAALLQLILKGSKKNTGEQMPGFAFMPDEDIASVVSYIRGAWYNQADSVSATDVQKERKKAGQ
ncbi:PQQ-dependent sugar dehydrogenase [Chitinophaga barathri]|uniref:Quinoprotein glucose dehydrogenase n=1 Tax=Chitinophaga barathri TaxID=1647451 RepID=A0A3N4MMY0_9BACT|nr:PQQ-dependent sugar dehydrogenase [Chitinophaga barathri]RPD41400.1 quinoprotein glucose dehydrogenase [Chitinophaga barathri]